MIFETVKYVARGYDRVNTNSYSNVTSQISEQSHLGDSVNLKIFNLIRLLDKMETRVPLYFLYSLDVTRF